MKEERIDIHGTIINEVYVCKHHVVYEEVLLKSRGYIFNFITKEL